MLLIMELYQYSKGYALFREPAIGTEIREKEWKLDGPWDPGS